MRISVLYGQGNGYGDGNVYVCKSKDLNWDTENVIIGRFINKDGVDVTENAIEALKHGSYSKYDSMINFHRTFRDDSKKNSRGKKNNRVKNFIYSESLKKSRYCI